MAKAKKKKIGIVDIVVLGVLVVCLVLSIVGLSIDQWTTTEEVFGSKASQSFSDYSDLVAQKNEDKQEIEDSPIGDFFGNIAGEFEETDFGAELKGKEAKLDAMVAFGYITVILVAEAKLDAMVAFGYITVILVAVTLALYVLKMFLKAGFFRFLVLVAGALTLISGVLAIAMTAAFCGEALLIGAGAALLAVGGMLGGLAGGASFFLSKK